MINGTVASVALSPVSAIESYNRMTKVKSSRPASNQTRRPLSMPKYLTDTHWKLKTYDKGGRVQTWIYLRETGDLVHEIRAGEPYRLGASDTVMPGACFNAVC